MGGRKLDDDLAVIVLHWRNAWCDEVARWPVGDRLGCMMHSPGPPAPAEVLAALDGLSRTEIIHLAHEARRELGIPKRGRPVDLYKVKRRELITLLYKGFYLYRLIQARERGAYTRGVPKRARGDVASYLQMSEREVQRAILPRVRI